MAQKSPNHLVELQPGFLPLHRAAAWAGVSVRTMKRWIADGLPKYQAGPHTKVLIRLKDIEGFLIKQQMPTPDLDSLVEDALAELSETKTKTNL